MARKSKINFRKLFKSITILAIIVIVLIYFVSKLYSQQQTLSQQKKDHKYYADQCEQLEKEKKELESQKGKINSKEYIESIAREKLNMFYPKERLYLDASTAP